MIPILQRIWEILYFPTVIRFWVMLGPVDTVPTERSEETKASAKRAWRHIIIGILLGTLLFAFLSPGWTVLVLYLLIAVIRQGENWSDKWHKSWMTWRLGGPLFSAFIWIICLMFFPWLAALL